MYVEGNLRRMKVQTFDNLYVKYYLISNQQEPLLLNDFIGKEIKLQFTGVINCILCGAVTKRSFAQGFCYSCMKSAPEAEECVLKPELCKAHLGVARDIQYAQEHCLIPHYVYLANTGSVKVGVTRETQLPVRWIDQGAYEAIRVCKTPSRHIAGVIERHLMQIFSDKTSWKGMVSGIVDKEIDLIKLKSAAIEKLTLPMKQYVCDDDNVVQFNYPVKKYPFKPETITFDKTAAFEGELIGIKGQYLFFNADRVFNVRRHSGYSYKLLF
ncbi:DUF2797 domain-containing protein [Marinilabiliaceae bacterium ANBcel2]|nr:DUF2797 domain-containing protein [Marinilabiliaceae bacterium ANBcel2]